LASSATFFAERDAHSLPNWIISSDTAKTPTRRGIRGMPPRRLEMPKESRTDPIMGSMPMVPIKRPIAAAAMPFFISPTTSSEIIIRAKT